MTTGLVDIYEIEQGPAWCLLDTVLQTVVIENESAPEIDSPVLETTLPFSSMGPRREDARPPRRPGRLIARWIPDPRGERGLICTWVSRNGTEPSALSVNP